MRPVLSFVCAVMVAAGFQACGDAASDTDEQPSSATAGGFGGAGGVGEQGGANSTPSAGGQGGAGGEAIVHSAAHGSASSVSGAGGGCQNVLPTIVTPPLLLSQTGLYVDPSGLKVSPFARAYEPQWKLWADGAEKLRYIYLPECGNIDTQDMDDWQFPVGTRAWKEFSLSGKRLETRLMVKTGPNTKDILYATYRWNEAQTDATLVLGGEKNVLGTDHDIPDELGCKRCHGPYPAKGGVPSRFLGFGALQLSHDGPGVTLSTLLSEGRLSVPPAANFTVPGTSVERQALGYLHANCGSCHNDTSEGLLFPKFNARLKTTDADVLNTGAYKTMVNQKTELFIGYGCDYRIAGGSTANSCSYFRMSERGTDNAPNLKQMPPSASEVVDVTGLGLLGAWIATLPAPAP